jgi:hypothetical protein
MGGGYLTQPFYHMAPRQTMPYSTSDFGLNFMYDPRLAGVRSKKIFARFFNKGQGNPESSLGV